MVLYNNLDISLVKIENNNNKKKENKICDIIYKQHHGMYT